MTSQAADIFARLAGTWDFVRDIPGQGRIEGVVTFSPLSPTRLQYVEKGLFYRESGDVLEAGRRYVYELQGERIFIYYDDPERHDEVMHELLFTNGTAQHTHQCGADRYALDFSMNGEIEMTYRVSGPEKDYAMSTRLKPRSSSASAGPEIQLCSQNPQTA